jgi:hypothetical protein
MEGNPLRRRDLPGGNYLDTHRSPMLLTVTNVVPEWVEDSQERSHLDPLLDPLGAKLAGLAGNAPQRLTSDLPSVSRLLVLDLP